MFSKVLMVSSEYFPSVVETMDAIRDGTKYDALPR